MKELSIEEKAHRYDEALKEAVVAHKDEDKHLKATLERIFPELKESEDEKVRKTLIHIVKGACDKYGIKYQGKEIGEEKLLAWLEKQGEQKPVEPQQDMLSQEKYAKAVDECIYGEQKPADKVEPKFKKGDWVVVNDGRIGRISECTKDFADVDFEFSRLSTRVNNIRFWTIQDAKDGDVLACPNDAGDRDVVFIFKNINSDDGWVFCFCASDANGCFCTNNDYVGNYNSTNISPATKEQRELLFAKMKEAGYEWNAEKKEIKKIGQKPTNNQFTPEQASVLDKHIDKFVGQKHAWSEEDGEIINNIGEYLNRYGNYIADKNEEKAAKIYKSADWLKSLKDRVQPKQELSKEDEVTRNALINLVEMYYGGCIDKSEKNRFLSWLKSLRPQNAWKPSDEQMEALKEACDEHWEPDGLDPLYTLYQDLKKLKS